MTGLLEYLSSVEGRTHANCVVADYFICKEIEEHRGELPLDLAEILSDMGSILHDTVSSPTIAFNFESTPEQLLKRAKQVRK